MKKGFWNKRIPTLLGLVSLVFFVGVVTWFGRYYTEVRSRASGGETPSNVQVSNITSNSFTVTYTTETKTTGVVLYGRDVNLAQSVFDVRDLESGEPQQYQVHFVTIKNLEAGTRYYFAIKSGATDFLDNSKPYEAVTSSVPENKPGADYNLAGEVNLPDGYIPVEGIVAVAVDGSGGGLQGSQLLTGLLREDGSYSLKLGSMMTKELSAYLELGPDTVLQLVITNGEAQSSVVLTAAQANSVPLVTLSKNYDFKSGVFHVSDDLAATESGTASESGIVASPSPFPAFDTTAALGPDILIPKQGESFVDRQPLFQGTAIPGELVNITIGVTPPLVTTVQSDELGNWQFRPADPIVPGNYLLTIVSNDQSGDSQTITRSFTVFAEGSQFVEPSVSPLASPTDANPVTPEISVTPVISATDTPTLMPTATLTPTLTPTATLTLDESLTMAALSATPDAGSLTLTAGAQAGGASIAPSGNYSLAFMGILSALFITAGFVVFFL